MSLLLLVCYAGCPSLQKSSTFLEKLDSGQFYLCLTRAALLLLRAGLRTESGLQILFAASPGPNALLHRSPNMASGMLDTEIDRHSKS